GELHLRHEWDAPSHVDEPREPARKAAALRRFEERVRRPRPPRPAPATPSTPRPARRPTTAAGRRARAAAPRTPAPPCGRADRWCRSWVRRLRKPRTVRPIEQLVQRQLLETVSGAEAAVEMHVRVARRQTAKRHCQATGLLQLAQLA